MIKCKGVSIEIVLVIDTSKTRMNSGLNRENHYYSINPIL